MGKTKVNKNKVKEVKVKDKGAQVSNYPTSKYRIGVKTKDKWENLSSVGDKDHSTSPEGGIWNKEEAQRLVTLLGSRGIKSHLIKG